MKDSVVLFRCNNCTGVVQYTKAEYGMSGWGHYVNGGSCIKASVDKESWKHYLIYKKALKNTLQTEGSP